MIRGGLSQLPQPVVAQGRLAPRQVLRLSRVAQFPPDMASKACRSRAVARDGGAAEGNPIRRASDQRSSANAL